MEDGLGVGDEQGEVNLDDNTQWDTTAWSRQNDAPEDFSPGEDCTPPGSPDTTMQYVRVTKYVDGAWVCSWKVCGPAS